VSSEQYRAQDCLSDIVDNIERIEHYVAGLDRDGLANMGRDNRASAGAEGRHRRSACQTSE
jgi:uncharacterized protein with HEPN domain